MCSAKRFKVRPKARCGWPRAVHGYLRESHARQTRLILASCTWATTTSPAAFVRRRKKKDPCASSEQLFAAFARADAPAVIRLLDEGFGGKVYSLRSLFRDEQRKILSLILRDTELDAAAAHRGIYQPHAQLMRFLIDLGVPVPKSFQTAAEITLNDQLLQALQITTLDRELILGLLKEAASVRVALDVPTLEYATRKKVEQAAAAFAAEPSEIEVVKQFQGLLEFLDKLPFAVVIWEAQNLAYPALLAAQSQWRSGQETGKPEAKTWLEHLGALQQKLKLQIA